MGGTVGALTPEIPVINKEVFSSLAGAIYSDSLFNLLSKDGVTIDKDTFLAFVHKAKDIFITHDWGTDELGRKNHDRAARLNKALQKKGLRVWFDEEMMNGDIQAKMGEGIDHCACFVILITKRYLDKVAGKGEKGTLDNCYYEFSYAASLKGRDKMVPVVAEPRCKNASAWYGKVGQVLGQILYEDYTKDENFDAMVIITIVIFIIIIIIIIG